MQHCVLCSTGRPVETGRRREEEEDTLQVVGRREEEEDTLQVVGRREEGRGKGTSGGLRNERWVGRFVHLWWEGGRKGYITFGEMRGKEEGILPV